MEITGIKGMEFDGVDEYMEWHECNDGFNKIPKNMKICVTRNTDGSVKIAIMKKRWVKWTKIFEHNMAL
ncbi:hypothetical protein KAR91_48425 [Candidatus Pacearchaeota archaeon]|nr:hypothetical protein [Candidatus Pacearchaeota archaeon]